MVGVRVVGCRGGPRHYCRLDCQGDLEKGPARTRLFAWLDFAGLGRSDASPTNRIRFHWSSSLQSRNWAAD